jgi:aminopeptidase N
MQWFNDALWIKVFNFWPMIRAGGRQNSNYDLQIRHRPLPAAYGIDRTTGANPIRSRWPACRMRAFYGNIISTTKRPSLMRQLGSDGARAFRQNSLREPPANTPATPPGPTLSAS